MIDSSQGADSVAGFGEKGRCFRPALAVRMSAQKKRNFKIEAFKHRVELDPNYAERTWRVLEHAIHEIYNHNASGLSFEELYRCNRSPRSLIHLRVGLSRIRFW
ncbi:hypothetical protein BHM03_00022265 [Ensete ventricosum]|uniref:Cullin N-terminal domain-containing protein n=1 Tax=Ensete ventricosum TaxID=4639 RepID=A0A445MGG0_ENSVE|nr:hypothetical protein BHM03_00022265 [Ensete ventricosum]